jgi:hypothetical protein
MSRFVFVVAGSSRFPLDMLRYDMAHPTTPASVEQMALTLDAHPRAFQQELLVKLTSKEKPTVHRWKTFGWKVISCTGLKEGEPTWVSIKEAVEEVTND